MPAYIRYCDLRDRLINTYYNHNIQLTEINEYREAKYPENNNQTPLQFCTKWLRKLEFNRYNVWHTIISLLSHKLPLEFRDTFVPYRNLYNISQFSIDHVIEQITLQQSVTHYNISSKKKSTDKNKSEDKPHATRSNNYRGGYKNQGRGGYQNTNNCPNNNQSGNLSPQSHQQNSSNIPTTTQ